MSSEIAIKVEGLSKCYQIYDTPRDRLKQFALPRLQRTVGLSPKHYFSEFWALRNVSFDLKKGETVGIIGRNGSGKSTLLQMICGTLSPTDGSIHTYGRIAALLELGSGFNSEFTGRENIYMNGAVLGLIKEEIDALLEDILAFADIGDFVEQPVKTYSSGMVVRLAFAVAVAVQPDILIVDEALSVGDEAFQRKCFARIEEIKRAGGTILFVTHATQLVVEMCDRAVLLHQGELIFWGDSHRAVNLYYKIIGKSGDASILDLIELESTQVTSLEIEKNYKSIISESDSVIKEESIKGCSPKDYIENFLLFDTSLFSQTNHEIHEKKYGVNISAISLENMSSSRINILSPDQCYILSFDVDFTRSPNNISYQVLFKTVNGLPIAGDRFFHAQTFDVSPSASDKLRIYYEFKCLMNPGVYFISIEACGDEEGQNVVYHKFAEVLAFRVLAKGKVTSIGYTSIMPKISMKDFHNDFTGGA